MTDVLQVLTLLQTYGCAVAVGKCQGGYQETAYLGCRSRAARLSPDPAMVAAVRKFPAPTDISHVHSLLVACKAL